MSVVHVGSKDLKSAMGKASGKARLARGIRSSKRALTPAFKKGGGPPKCASNARSTDYSEVVGM